MRSNLPFSDMWGQYACDANTYGWGVGRLLFFIVPCTKRRDISNQNIVRDRKEFDLQLL